MVLPGDQVSTSEELLPGDGTYEEDGVIKASRMGQYIVDSRSRRATVQPVTSVPVVIHRNDTVIARVDMVKPSMIVAEVIHVVGKDRSVSGDTNATLHVKEIARGYVKDASTEFRVGDYFRARVIQVEPSLQLTTKDDNLGSIKALCVNCRNVLQNKGNSLECPNCGKKERRRIARDYGSVDITKL